MTPDFILQLMISLAAGAGVYAAIRADLARSIALAEQAVKSSDEAHRRIDAHIGHAI